MAKRTITNGLFGAAMGAAIGLASAGLFAHGGEWQAAIQFAQAGAAGGGFIGAVYTLTKAR